MTKTEVINTIKNKMKDLRIRMDDAESKMNETESEIMKDAYRTEIHKLCAQWGTMDDVKEMLEGMED